MRGEGVITGLAVKVEREGASFARLAVSDPASSETSALELGVDWRAFPPVRLAVGPVLHPVDAAANKLCALFGRAAVRGLHRRIRCTQGWALYRFGFGVVPGGGAFDWLPRLVGRSRALEILATGDDFDARTAAEYGWINRALPDDELDAFVDRVARRLAGFDKRALSAVKRLVNERLAPPSPGISCSRSVRYPTRSDGQRRNGGSR